MYTSPRPSQKAYLILKDCNMSHFFKDTLKPASFLILSPNSLIRSYAVTVNLDGGRLIVEGLKEIQQ